ncbi:MAG: hypothetical protein LUE89_01585 [Clostridiales bacterium]|nr:hypothetical protein [Clostridiales bacterium]
MFQFAMLNEQLAMIGLQPLSLYGSAAGKPYAPQETTSVWFFHNCTLQIANC